MKNLVIGNGNEAVNRGNAITRKEKKCTNLVIENGVDIAKRQFYYEKSALGEKSRNRMRDEVLKKIVLLREKVENAQIS